MFAIAEVAVIVCEGTQGHVGVSQSKHTPHTASRSVSLRAIGLAVSLEVVEGGAGVPQASPRRR